MLHAVCLGPADAPTLVFLHGLAGSTASWGPVFHRLAGPYRVMLVDALGFGRSPKPPLGYTVADHLAALDATLRHHGVAHAHWVGHSMGALLALAYASEHPAQVDGLVLMALPWYRNEGDARRQIARQSLFNRWLALETPVARVACWAMCHLRPWLMPWMPRFLPGVPPEVARDTLRHTWLSYSRTMRHVVIGSTPQAWLARYPGPVLFIQGLRDDTAPLAAVLAGVGPSGQAAVDTLDAGHDMVFTHAEVLADRVARFAARPGAGGNNGSRQATHAGG